MSNVTQLPRDKAPDLLCGPFEYYAVIVQDRKVPRLTGRKREDGSISLTVDGRFGADFSTPEDASQAAWLIAQASAIAAGYPHFEATSKDAPFAPIMMQVGSVPSAVVTPLHPEGDPR